MGVEMGSQLAANCDRDCPRWASPIVAAGYSWWTSRDNMQGWNAMLRRATTGVEKSTAYLELEVHSSEAFRSLLLNMPMPCVPTKPARSPADCAQSRDRRGAELMRQYYFQCLNLFEVCSNFRRNGVID